MKAVCVNAERKLEVRDVPVPSDPPSGYLVVEIKAAAINHGDKAFLANPGTAGALMKNLGRNVWGASAAGTVRAVGEGVSADLVGSDVAIYRSLNLSEHTIGLWSEFAQVSRTSCLVLPASVSAKDYAGSLVNVITAHAFLEQVSAEGHKGVIVTAGNSATGLALAALAKRRGMPAIFLVRSAEAAAKLRSLGVEQVLVTGEDGFEQRFDKLAAQLGATAVFDGVGGELTSRIAPHLQIGSVIFFYGFLGAAAPITLSTFVLMSKDLVLRRFSNFNSPTVADPQRLKAALGYLEGVIDDPLFRTHSGREFPLEQIDEAMAWEATPAAKAVLVPGHPAVG